jgi:hypothetical protein
MLYVKTGSVNVKVGLVREISGEYLVEIVCLIPVNDEEDIELKCGLDLDVAHKVALQLDQLVEAAYLSKCDEEETHADL